MKKLAMIVGLSLIFALYSCGVGDSKKEEKNAGKAQSSSAKTVTFSTKYLSIELPSGWVVSQYGAHNAEGFSIFSFIAGSSGGDLRDGFNKDHEVISEDTETTVDGLPAVTRKQKYMQNEVKILRTWIIDDGKNLISFNVAAPEKVFNDDKANELVKKVIVTNHYDTNSGEEKTSNKMAKPAEFPQKTFNEISDIFSENAVLSDEKIANAVKALKALKGFEGTVDDNRGMAIADSVAKANGVDNFEELTTKILPTAYTAVTVLKLMEETESYNNDVKRNMAMDMIKGFVTQNNISAADLKYTYDNWDKVAELMQFEK